MGYKCKNCGAEANVDGGLIVRSCNCTCGIIADMKATAYGEGHAQTGGKVSRFAEWFVALLKARPK